MQATTVRRAATRHLCRRLTAAFLLAQLSLPIIAQTTSSADTARKDDVVRLEKFEVTAGFRGSLQAAAEIKQTAPGVVEVIAAEDIGKLPDVSIADSLNHVTGLTTQRVNGRAQAINIRGLTGDYSTGLLNGREQVSTSENRAVEFDQYPADLINQVMVYKTAAPNLIDQGLAGTIDLQTVRPLNKPKRIVAVNAYYDWTQYSQLTPGAKSHGEHASLSYIDQLADGTVGIALGLSHTNRPFEGEQFQAWGYPTDAAGNFVLGGTKSYVRTSNLKRDSLMGVVENEVAGLHSVVDVFVSRFEEKQLLRGMEIPLWWSSAALQPGYTISGGLATSGTFTNVQPVVRNDVFKRNDSPFSIGWNVQAGAKSAWPVTFDAGYSRVTRSDVNLETYSGVGYRAGTTTAADTMTVQLSPGNIPVITPHNDYSSGNLLRLTDPQGWGSTSLPGGGMMGYLKYFQAKDELGQLRLSTTHALTGFFSDFEAGASYSERYKRDGENPSGFVNSPSNAQQTLPLPAQIGTTDMSYLGLGRIYAYDPLAAYSAGVWGFTPNLDTGIVANRFAITEKLGQLYGQLNVHHTIGEMPLTGNLGARVIRTDQSSTGYSANGNALNTVTDGDKYTDFAPSLNLTIEVMKDTLVRVGLARQIARPRMYDMRAERSWGYNASLSASNDLSRSPWSGSGGNAHLKPWRADAIDLSIEKYFHDHDGYISLAGFHKKLLTYIYTQNSLANFGGYPSQGTTPLLNEGIVSQPVNGSGGRIQGVELTISLMSELLNKNFRGFGLQLGGAYTDSSIRPWGPANDAAPIAGLSRKMANATLYYELHGFSARVTEHYQSASRQYITTFGPPNRGGDVSPGSGFTLAQPERVIDAQVSYTFQQTRLRGMTFYLQAYNLNNEPLITYNNGDARQVMNYQKYGASYSAGVAYRF